MKDTLKFIPYISYGNKILSLISNKILSLISDELAHSNDPYYREMVANELFSGKYNLDSFLKDQPRSFKSNTYLLQRCWSYFNNDTAWKQMADYLGVSDFIDVNNIIVQAIQTRDLKVATSLNLYVKVLDDDSFSLKEQSVALNYINDYIDLDTCLPPIKYIHILNSYENWQRALIR